MLARYRQALRSAQRSALLIGYILLGLAAIGLIIYLREAEKPWEKGVEARVAAGRNVKVIHHVITGLWYGTWINLILVVGLAIALPFLTQPLVGMRMTRAGISGKSRTAFAIAALAATAAAFFISLPGMGSSIWGDEEYTLRRSVLGDYERNAEDVVEWRPVSWRETFWSYKKPNNHILNSALMRLSHQAFYRPSDDPAKHHFSEPILRLPAFLAALGAIAATGYALACFGFVRAGILAMFLLALHPWFVRYSTEARGYAFILLFIPLATAFLMKAVRRGRWSYWIAYCLCEFLMFIAYPGCLYLLVGINLAGLCMVLKGRGGWPARRVQFARFSLANIVSGMLVVQLMAPCYAQMKEYLTHAEGQHFESLHWLHDNLAFIVSGQPWHSWSTHPLCFALDQRPTLGLIFTAAAVAAVVAGTIRLWRASLQTRFLLLLFLLPWPLFLIGSELQKTLLYHWYTIFALVPTLMLMALGVEWLSRAKFWGDAQRFRWLGAPAFLILFAVITLPKVVGLRENSVEPMRESVALTRQIVNPDAPGIDAVITIGFYQPARAYDPTMYYIRKSDPEGKFEGLLARSHEEGKPLFVNLSMPGGAAGKFPEIMAMVNDPEQFEELKALPGLMPFTSRNVYRYIGKKEEADSDG